MGVLFAMFAIQLSAIVVILSYFVAMKFDFTKNIINSVLDLIFEGYED